jgi:hypothetical protein
MDKAFSVENMPTYFGKSSYWYAPETKSVTVQVERTPSGGVVADFAVAVELAVNR